MIWLLKWLIMGHSHKWKTIDQRPYITTYQGKVSEKGVRYIQQCETCGIVVKRDLI